MPESHVKIHLHVSEYLGGLKKTRSALDEFHKSAASGFAKTTSAIHQATKSGLDGVVKMKTHVVALQTANLGAQQAVLQNSQAQSQLNQELMAGTVAAAQQAAVMAQLQAAQKAAAQEAKTSVQSFRSARQELQSYLGALFGTSAGGSTASAGAFGGISDTSAINSALPGNIGLGAAGGAGAASRGRTPNLASAMGLPASTPIGSILGGLFSHGLGSISGRGLAMGGLALGSLTIGNQNRAVSTLGGVGSGALVGFSVGGPIGAAVGGLIGGIVGLITGGDGKNKTHDADIANQGFAQLHQILDDYNNFRTAYSAAITSSDTIWNKMVSQWVRPQSAISQRPYFDQIITSMEQTENARVARQQLQGMMAVPEFSSGGLVSPGGGMLAVVHSGEFVMTRQAVDRIGTSVLQGLNSGSQSTNSGGGMQITLDPDTGAWLEQTLAANPKALQKGIGVILRSGGPISRALRG